MYHRPIDFLTFFTVPVPVFTNTVGVTRLTNVASATVVTIATWPMCEVGHDPPQCSEQDAHNSKIRTTVGNPR